MRRFTTTIALPASWAQRFAMTSLALSIFIVRTGLENVGGKWSSSFSFNNFFSRLHDQRGTLRIEQAKIAISLRGGPSNQAKSANERP